MRNEFLIALAVVVIGVFLISGYVLKEPKIPENVTEKNELKRFSSYDEIKNFLKANTEASSYYGGFGVQVLTSAERTTGAAAPAPTETAKDYSTTNIQVAGVDEADIVKNDGKYIYVVSEKKIVIIDAYPAKDAKILSEIELNGTPSQIFINGNKLTVFGQTDYNYYIETLGVSKTDVISPRHYTQETFVKVYDVSDRQNPILKRNVSLEGYYFNSRMIGDYVYVIINQPVYFTEPQPVPLPIIYSGTRTKAIAPAEIYYFDYPDSSYVFTNILAINTQNDDEDLTSKTFLTGYSQNVYVSTDNIYITYSKRLSEFVFYDKIIEEVIIPSSPSDVQDQINDIKNSNISKYEKIDKINEVFRKYVESLNPEEAANIMKDVEKKTEDVQIEISK